jgi:hypothetical protein
VLTGIEDVNVVLAVDADPLKDQPSGSFAHSAMTRYLNWPDPTIIEHSLSVHPFEIRASGRRSQTASSYVLASDVVKPVPSQYAVGRIRGK